MVTSVIVALIITTSVTNIAAIAAVTTQPCHT
jgi:hypothetical protein